MIVALLVGCSAAQVDRSDPSLFSARGYRTYQWNYAAIEVLPTDEGPDANVRPIFREEVNRALGNMGYQEVEAGGEFVVSLQFRTTIEEGALPRTKEQNPLVPRSVLNRTPDQASVDNAIALAGPREMSTILLQFNAADSQTVLWDATMSRVIETANRNEIEPEKVRRYARQALRSALIRIPRAPN